MRRLNRISTLVAGHNSFSFFLVEGQLRATFRGKSTHPLASSDGLDSDSDGVVSPRWTMPVGNRWLKLAFIHDGVDTMELYVDDQLIARSLLESDCLKKVLAELEYGALDCDPQFKAFLQHATQSNVRLDQRASKGEHNG
jgi:hypothetical protein